MENKKDVILLTGSDILIDGGATASYYYGKARNKVNVPLLFSENYLKYSSSFCYNHSNKY